MISVDNFFVFFEMINFCCDVAICDLVHDVEAIFHLFHGHHSYFRKEFQMVLTLKEGYT